MALSEQMKGRIEALLQQKPLVLFMKGTKSSPRCGFSASVIEILDQFEVDYQDINVLEDPLLREAIKEFANWPTIPQLYYRGEFIGGSDIVRTLYEQGELQKLLHNAPKATKKESTSNQTSFVKAPPYITITPPAQAALQNAIAQTEPGTGIRLRIKNQGMVHELALENKDDLLPSDVTVESQGISIFLDPASAALANGVVISFVTSAHESGFEIENPNAPAPVKQISVKELKRKLEAKESFKLYDVRTEAERKIAQIPGAIWLTEEEKQKIEHLPKDTALVFHCHHGGRSQAAAEFYAQKGFRHVFNVHGGIDAWSKEIDSSVQSY